MTELKLDRATMKISAFFVLMDGLLFKKPMVSVLYDRHWKLFNSAVVEGTGVIIYYLLVPLALQFFSTLVAFNLAWFFTTCFIVPVSFLTKYAIYNRWLFK